ncbi:trypsin-like peptidase domain-containing protein [Saccharopolyspora erythraea]|uniref:S1C family serine protease n=1 Tax=Saccharopolyspora erythraea TaxID=1836 RepID=UPI001BF175D4|nr:trypsin-like peptidase domain-containing protein [Saccharopolyspora erythraea]QUH04075.1 trypsin-like peptidase domain-containing protein [Saccharopolyspora erythraea]
MTERCPAHSKRLWHRWAGIAVTLVLVVLGACTDLSDRQPPPGQDQQETNASPPGEAGTLAVVPDLVERLGPSVVTVQLSEGSGSGVVYRADGLIVTNEHVVRGAREVTVAFADGTRAQGQVRATDRRTDLAVVQVPRHDLPAPQFARELPRKGVLAVAIGTPLGLENTVTSGIVSGLGREVPAAAHADDIPLIDLIQTDAPISPGSSGGALLDAAGRVIGINQASAPSQLGAESIGFAIPSTTVVSTVEQLLADGTAQHPYLGASMVTVTDTLRQAMKLQVQRGAIVLNVEPDSPAAAAGVQPADVIVRFAGQDITNVENVLGALRNIPPGQTAPLTVRRGGQAVELTVTVAERP